MQQTAYGRRINDGRSEVCSAELISGLLAMTDQLAELRDQSLHGLDTNRSLSSDRITAQAGTGASGGSSESFTASAASGSSGIGATGTGDERRLQSGAGLGDRQSPRLNSSH